ncbi:MAG TPA: GntR family transcriptional regulator [Pseudonocardia sp.]|jgi:DNA-binding GntR family transcriptional regulator|nr:GntR family transcriptional regulator [Pseudonocardia sp.]
MTPSHLSDDAAGANPWPGGPGRGHADLGVAGTVRDRVAAVLRERILNGDLLRGARLDLDQLADEFGTSRTPVREAILALAHEGLTHVTPRSRATVVGLTPQDVRDNFTLMAVLSGLAASLAAQRMSADELARITELGGKLELAEGADMVRLNWLFHREINLASHSRSLLTQLRMCGQLVPQTFFAVIPEQTSCSRLEHQEIMQSLRERDAERVRQVTERHFGNAGRLLSTRIEEAISARQSA